jgi:hypothetical protein
MTDLRDAIEAMGYSRVEALEILDVVERNAAAEREAIRVECEIARAAELIRLIFLRVDRDSPAGCALRRALGFSGGASFAKAAKDFGVSKQYLHTLQAELEQKLGPLAFLSAAERAARHASTGPSQASEVDR